MNIPSDLFTKFNEVTYYDEPHKYYVNNKELISVTTLIHKYQEEFNEDYWLDYKSNQLNLHRNDIKRTWDFTNKLGTMKGSIIHNYIENLLQNKKFEYPVNQILNEFGYDPIQEEYEITKKHVDSFIKDTKDKLIPIKTELVIYDEIAQIGGMIDILNFNVKMKEFQIWDNKTNKKLTTNNKFNNKLLGDLSLLDDCDLEIYSLQLGLYKKIIERNTNIKLGDSYIIWFSHLNDTYKVIKTLDREYYVNKIIENRINEIN